MGEKHEESQADPVQLPAGVAPQGIELRHPRYFVEVAGAGSFTQAAERMFIAQPTLSQQIRRLEEVIGTQLLQRRRDGLRLTTAGTALLDASRDVLSLVDHGMSRTRQAAGPGRQRLRVVVPPRLPEAIAVQTASALRAAAAAADVDVIWMETTLDTEFSLIRRRGPGLADGQPRRAARPAGRDDLGRVRARRLDPRRAPGGRTRDDRPGGAGQAGGHPRAAPSRAGYLRRLAVGSAGRGTAI
jgi:DNA-binding transcriptional LysR family regulator